MGIATVLSTWILMASIFGAISVPGYASTVLMILFMGSLNLTGLGLVGTYAWRTYENSKARPQALVSARLTHTPRSNFD